MQNTEEGSNAMARPHESPTAAPTTHAHEDDLSTALTSRQECRRCNGVAGSSQKNPTDQPEVTAGAREGQQPDKGPHLDDCSPCPSNPPQDVVQSVNVVDGSTWAFAKGWQTADRTDPSEPILPTEPFICEQAAAAKPAGMAVKSYAAEPCQPQSTSLAAEQDGTSKDVASCEQKAAERFAAGITAHHVPTNPEAAADNSEDFQDVLGMPSSASNSLAAGYEASLDISNAGSSHVSTTALSYAIRLSSNLRSVLEEPQHMASTATEDQAHSTRHEATSTTQPNESVHDANKGPKCLAIRESARETANSGTLSTHCCDPSDIRLGLLDLGSAPVDAICSRPAMATAHDEIEDNASVTHGQVSRESLSNKTHDVKGCTKAAPQPCEPLATRSTAPVKSGLFKDSEMENSATTSDQVSHGSSEEGRVLIGCITTAPHTMEALVALATAPTKDGTSLGNKLGLPLADASAGGSKLRLHDKSCTVDDNSARISALPSVEKPCSTTPRADQMQATPRGLQKKTGERRQCKPVMLAETVAASAADGKCLSTSASPTPRPGSLRARYSTCSSSAASYTATKCSQDGNAASGDNLRGCAAAEGDAVVCTDGTAEMRGSGAGASRHDPVKWESLCKAWKARKAGSPGQRIASLHSTKSQSIGGLSQAQSSVDWALDDHAGLQATQSLPSAHFSLGQDSGVPVADVVADFASASPDGPVVPPPREKINTLKLLEGSAAASLQGQLRSAAALSANTTFPKSECLPDSTRSAGESGGSIEAPFLGLSTCIDDSLTRETLHPARSLTFSYGRRDQPSESHPVSSALPTKADQSETGQESAAKVAWLTASSDTSAWGATSRCVPLNAPGVHEGVPRRSERNEEESSSRYTPPDPHDIYENDARLFSPDAEDGCTRQLRAAHVTGQLQSPQSTGPLSPVTQRLRALQGYELQNSGSAITLPSMPSDYTIDSNVGAATELGPLPTPRFPPGTRPQKQPRSHKSDAPVISSHALFGLPTASPPARKPGNVERARQTEGPVNATACVEQQEVKGFLNQQTVVSELPRADLYCADRGAGHVSDSDISSMKVRLPRSLSCLARFLSSSMHVLQS
jgi:hypothetical protein